MWGFSVWTKISFRKNAFNKRNSMSNSFFIKMELSCDSPDVFIYNVPKKNKTNDPEPDQAKKRFDTKRYRQYI